MNSRAMTLMEVLIVVILIATIAGFSIVSYRRAVLKARERDAVLNLSVIHGANQIYRAKHTDYWDTSGNVITNLDLIMQELEINIAANDMFYSYESDIANEPDIFWVYATWHAGQADEFGLRADENIISETNPCCYVGDCPSRPACL